MSCFYNKTDKAIIEAYYGCLVPAMSYVDLPDELSYYSIRSNVKEIPNTFGITSDMNFSKIIPKSERYRYKHYRSIYHKDANTIETCIVPSLQEGAEIIVSGDNGNVLTKVKGGLDATLKLATAGKKPCLYNGREPYPVFIAPGGINEDYGKEGDMHVQLFSPPPGTLQLQATGDKTMKGETVVFLLYDAGKKAMYMSRSILNSKTGEATLTPTDFSAKTGSGVDTLSTFTKGSTCCAYNDFFNGAVFTDQPIMISKEFTF